METIYQLEKSTPEAEGISSAAIEGFLDKVKESLDELHSFMLLRHGRVVAEGWWKPYGPNEPHILFSLSKSFTSTAIGFAITEGKIRLDDTVLSFFPESAPAEISENLAAMQVQHLLTMSTGHAKDTTQALFERPDRSWVESFLALPVEHQPGTFFLYNTGATYMLSAIVQKVTGEKLVEYLQPRLFEPLGISKPSWEESPQGINVGGFGLSLTTAEVARFGQLYLQKGQWQGRSVLSEEWIKAATGKQISTSTDPATDWAQGYGYQFWRNNYGDSYRGDGAFGQFCLVIPEQEAVLVITAGLNNGQGLLNLVWNQLLSAFEPTALPANPAAQKGLTQKLENLELAPVPGEGLKSVASKVTGKKFVLAENEQHIKAITFDFEGDACTLTIENEFSLTNIVCGSGNWQKSHTTFNSQKEREVGASGGWTSQDTYFIRLYFLTPMSAPRQSSNWAARIPFGLTITCRFSEAEVILEQTANQTMHPIKQTQLKGRLDA